MTNQNVVLSNAKVALSNSTVFHLVADKSLLPVSNTGNITLKKVTKMLETNGVEGEVEGAKMINSLLESMRASSPTRVKSSSPKNFSHQNEEKNSWIINHPCALSMFEQIMKDSRGKQIVMFLDYDGTLSSIVEDPDRAYMTNEMREAVRDVARHFPTAIVTGRCRDMVYNFVRLVGLYYAGSHGMDIKGPSKSRKYKQGQQPVLFQPASEFLPMIDEVHKALLENTKFIPGAKVENNKFCVSVHFRCVDEKMWATLAEQVILVLKNYPKLRFSQGRKVLEIRPTIEWDKGKALEFLLESLGYGSSSNVFPVYIGDDRSDEDAFKKISPFACAWEKQVLRDRGQGLGILVSKVPKETNASYSLQEPEEVKKFLRRLVEWKRRSLRGQIGL